MNKEKIKKYVITVSISIIATICLLLSFNFFYGELSLQEGMKALSDAFSVTGIILLVLGALVFVSTQGMFDSISYAGKFVLRAFIPGARSTPIEKYGDYKVGKAEKRITGYSFLFFVGIAFILVGVIFTILFFVV